MNKILKKIKEYNNNNCGNIRRSLGYIEFFLNERLFISKLKRVINFFGNDIVNNLFNKQKSYQGDRKKVNKMILSTILKKINEPIYVHKYWHFDIDNLELFLQFSKEPIIKLSLSKSVQKHDGIWEPSRGDFTISYNRLDLLPSFMDQAEFVVYTRQLIKRFKKIGNKIKI